MSDKGSGALEITLSFLLGTATGFVLGVLFAPQSGAETRKKIQDTAVKTGEKAKESYDRIAKEAEKGIKVVREKTSEGIDSIREFVEKKKEEFKQKQPITSEEKKEAS